jgi:SAM-dependent methyltransferase
MSDPSRAGSAALWGPLFGSGARTWAETWEGDSGWGGPAYELVLTSAGVGEGTKVLDCGCGAGRFARLAAARGAAVAGLDAADEMVGIASRRLPEGDHRVGDLESLPWPDDTFDLVTGFSSFQFAENKVRALSEAKRTSRGVVAVVIPVLGEDAGVAAVFQPVFPLFPEDGLASLRETGIYSLSAPGRLDEILEEVGLTVREDAEVSCPISFGDVDGALRAFMGAGPTALAIEHSGTEAVASAVRDGLSPFVSGEGVHLPGVYRAVIATG